MKLYQVVFHLDEPIEIKARGVLTNIDNLLNDMGDDAVQVELLANGAGVQVYLRNPGIFQEQIDRLKGRGVRFVACNNSLRALDIQLKDLMDSVEIVPAGVTELVMKQSEGWAYIKP